MEGNNAWLYFSHVHRSRGTENMEYLKNVIFHFMCADSIGREQLVIPLSTVLHFTPVEVSLANKHMYMWQL